MFLRCAVGVLRADLAGSADQAFYRGATGEGVVELYLL